VNRRERTSEGRGKGEGKHERASERSRGGYEKGQKRTGVELSRQSGGGNYGRVGNERDKDVR